MPADSSNRQTLVEATIQARLRAYAPYSKFFVGAALLHSSGEIITGANVENASYGLTICPERAATFTAVAKGLTDFEAIAICVEGAGAPGGACRQVLHEFAPNLVVLMTDPTGELIRETTLDQLLPDSFGPENLTTS